MFILSQLLQILLFVVFPFIYVIMLPYAVYQLVKSIKTKNKQKKD